MSDTPMTEAGRRLALSVSNGNGGLNIVPQVLAIEAEARAEALRRVDELREALADMVNQFGYWSDGENPGITTGGLSALEGAFAALGYDDPHPAEHLRCDEPGCTKQSSMGTPTTTGYRRTCHDHRPMGLTVGERAEQMEYQRTHPFSTLADWVASRRDTPPEET